MGIHKGKSAEENSHKDICTGKATHKTPHWECHTACRTTKFGGNCVHQSRAVDLCTVALKRLGREHLGRGTQKSCYFPCSCLIPLCVPFWRVRQFQADGPRGHEDSHPCSIAPPSSVELTILSHPDPQIVPAKQSRNRSLASPANGLGNHEIAFVERICLDSGGFVWQPGGASPWPWQSQNNSWRTNGAGLLKCSVTARLCQRKALAATSPATDCQSRCWLGRALQSQRK